MAAAEPSCDGGVPSGSDHHAFEIGPAGAASCVANNDTSDTSMTDIDEIGTWGMVDMGWSHGPQTNAHPQPVTGQ